tara:strand:- start:156 stop:1082 length:927 start_codon:yes stop_codon:yes gene_type:complete
MPIQQMFLGLGAGTKAVVNGGDRAVFFGGTMADSGPDENSMEYIAISSLGNGTDFGDLSSTSNFTKDTCGVSNISRGVQMTGYTPSRTAVMMYWTFGSPGNASSFGNLTAARSHGSGSSDGSRGVCWTGETGGNVIDYITIANTGDATDFGDSTRGQQAEGGGTADDTRGIFFKGDAIDYITIQTTGNTSDFGDTTVNVEKPKGCSADATRGVLAGTAYSPSNTIQYVTIQTTGNASDFGNISAAAYSLGRGGACNSTRMVMAGGETNNPGGAVSDDIQYIEVQTTGNTSDFGDLLNDSRAGGCVSGD